MADSTTANYKFKKPEVGASADSWGTKWNDNADDLDTFLSNQATRYLAGLELSVAGSTSTFGVAAGVAGANSGFLMKLASAFTKTTGSWTLGTAGGALDTGTVSNTTWYHVYLIRRPDTGVVDIAISLSQNAPSFSSHINSAYSEYRRIGGMVTDGSGNWLKFTQRGDEFLWDVGRTVTNTAIGTTATDLAVSQPPNVKVIALLQGLVTHSTSNTAVLFTSPDQADTAPTAVTGNFNAFAPAGGAGHFDVQIRTDGATVRVRAANASTGLQLAMSGWIDSRGK